LDVEYREKGSIKVIELETYDVMDSYDLEDYEMASCVAITSFDEEVVIVGTGYNNEEGEPTKGRILALSIRDGKLSVKGQFETGGCVYSAVGYRNKILASIGNKVGLFEWSTGTTFDQGWEDASGSEEDMVVKEPPVGQTGLQLVSMHYGHVLALHISVEGDDILVADLMKSVSILRFDESTQKLVERYRDPETHWMTSAEILQDQVIGCDSSYNVFMLRKPETGNRLEWIGAMQMGDQVNKVKRGKLCTGNDIIEPALVYVTVNGEIGMFSRLPSHFSVVEKIESAIAEKIVHPMSLKPAEYS
jgi:DNA damage-binding protein 1